MKKYSLIFDGVNVANTILFGFLVVFSHCAVAQTDVETKIDKSRHIVLKAGSYVDAREGRLVRPAILVIDQGVITAINPPVLPEDSTIIDLGVATLLPGLIDVHTHLMIETGDAAELVQLARNNSESDFLFAAIQNGYKTLMAGFTTVRDLDSWYFVDVTLSKYSEADGISIPRIIPAGHGINVSGPADYSNFFPPVDSLPGVGIADNKQELIESVDYQASMGVGVIKLYSTTGFTMSAYSDNPVGSQTYTNDEIETVVSQAEKHGLKVATHAHGSEGILAAVKAGVASIEHGSFLTDEIIEEMKTREIYLVPTTPIMNRATLKIPNTPPELHALRKKAIQSHENAIGAGVKIAYGTDAGLFPHGQNASGFLDLVEYGMSPAEAIQTATVNAADLLGVYDRGTVEVGKLADLIAVNGNPLEDVSLLQKVVFVMKNGKVYKN